MFVVDGGRNVFLYSRFNFLWRKVASFFRRKGFHEPVRVEVDES